MHDRTDLSSGQINGHDQLAIELIEPPDLPPFIAIKWPAKATVCTPAQLDAVVAATMRLLSNAVIELAALRVWKKI
jgi:hypothetical protein